MSTHRLCESIAQENVLHRSSMTAVGESSSVDVAKPYVGMTFTGMDEARSHYTQYGRQEGFSVRVRNSQKSGWRQMEGTVRLLFQPAEEGGAGASHMMKEGALGDAEAIYGMHIDATKPTGSIATVSGPALAAVSIFEARIQGKGGPASEPHSTVDPILAASFSILALQQLISREAHPLQSQVVSVTYVRGGTACNVIPPYVEFGGTLRSLSTEGLHYLQRRVKQVIEGQAAVHRCIAQIEMNREDKPPYPACVNDEGLHQHVKRIGQLMLGPENVKVGNKVMAGEDFAFYQQLIPGVMFSIGIRNEKLGSVHSPHSPYFFLDEEVLPIGSALHTALAETYINDHQESVLS